MLALRSTLYFRTSCATVEDSIMSGHTGDQTMLKTLQVLRRTTDDHLTGVCHWMLQLCRKTALSPGKVQLVLVCRHHVLNASPAMQILAMSSVVWISEWRSTAQPDNTSAPVAQDAEWVGLAEGPLFVCSRDCHPHHTIIIKDRSQTSGMCPWSKCRC